MGGFNTGGEGDGGGGGSVNSVSGGTNLNTTGTANDPILNLDADISLSSILTTNDVGIGGNLIVQGDITGIYTEDMLVSDPYGYYNAGYTAAVPTTAGQCYNIGATGLTDSVNGSFVNGVASTSNPYVETTGTATYSLSDIIQISNTPGNTNDGIYEVLSHIGNDLEIRGIGITGTVEAFTQNNFISVTTGSGNIEKVTVAVERFSTTGVLQTASGSVTGFVFQNVAVVAGSDTEILFNQSGSTGSNSNFTWDYGANILNVVGDVFTRGLLVSDSGDPEIGQINGSATTDEGYWASTVDADGIWFLRTVDDGGGSGEDLFTATRTGTVLDLLTIGAPTDFSSKALTNVASVNGADIISSGASTAFLNATGVYSAPHSIYNQNGTLTSDRTVTGENGDKLEFINYDLTSSDFLRRTRIVYDNSIFYAWESGDGAGGVIGRKSITFNSSAMTILDSESDTGLLYAADYSANFTDRSLVDRGFVENFLFQDIYDRGTPSVLVDNSIGPLTLKNTSKTVAPLRITPNATAPTTDLTGGEVSAGVDGQLYSYDSTRTKFLGLSPYALQFGKNNDADNEYLRFGGDARDGTAGVRLIKPATIVGISIQGSNATNAAEFEIEVDGSQVGSTYTTTAGAYVDATLNIDVALGERVNLFADNVSGPQELENVYAVIWIKDRIS